MPEILIFYFAGLLASAVVAVIFYYAIGGSISMLARAVLGRRTGALWGRSTRIFLLLTVLVGGLSTQWYGCDGYGNYKAIAANRRLMLQKSTDQVAGALRYGTSFIIFVAGVGAITVALLGGGRDAQSHGDESAGNALKPDQGEKEKHRHSLD